MTVTGEVIGMKPAFLLASHCPVRVDDDVSAGPDILCSMRSRRQKESFPLPLFMSAVTPCRQAALSGKRQKNDAGEHQYGGSEPCPDRSLAEPEQSDHRREDH